MALLNAIEGSRHTGQQIIWTHDDDTAQNLTGATLSGIIKNQRTGVETAIVGTLTLVTPASGIFTWAYAAADIARAGQYEVLFAADYGGGLIDSSHWMPWMIEPGPASTSTQPRPTMTDLSARVKDLIGPCSESVITDIKVQDALDRYRIKLNQLRLGPLQSLQVGGQVRYYEFTAPYQFWERGYVIQLAGNSASQAVYGTGQAWQNVTPSMAYDFEGRWTFTDYFYSDLFITGYSYDPFSAAGDLVDILAANELRSFNFSAGGQSFQRSQILQNYREFAKHLRSQGRIITTTIERSDVSS